MNRFSVSEDTLNLVLQYLGRQKYTEVSEIITKLSQDAKVIPEVLEKPTKKKEK